LLHGDTWVDDAGAGEGAGAPEGSRPDAIDSSTGVNATPVATAGGVDRGTAAGAVAVNGGAMAGMGAGGGTSVSGCLVVWVAGSAICSIRSNFNGEVPSPITTARASRPLNGYEATGLGKVEAAGAGGGTAL
jgi:hypothetical protein